MLNNFNKILEKNFNSSEELIQYLNEEFLKNYNHLGDIQEAFDLLNDKTKGNLGKYFCWSIGGWKVEILVPSEKSEQIFRKLNEWKNFKDWDDFSDYLTNQIEDDECNIGIDPYNALSLEIDELLTDTGLYLKNYISIRATDNTPILERL